MGWSPIRPISYTSVLAAPAASGPVALEWIIRISKEHARARPNDVTPTTRNRWETSNSTSLTQSCFWLLEMTSVVARLLDEWTVIRHMSSDERLLLPDEAAAFLASRNGRSQTGLAQRVGPVFMRVNASGQQNLLSDGRGK